ncbi:NAD(P)-dependent oxidoreductase [Silicimonas sp. MF1-12-2]|uniref:NAD(P)-dependent oxidoreductase n=1 Tax=Silicimonas sp. MF1-12-2 TaxID=3384793 RepID=UPI0039B6E01F
MKVGIAGLGNMGRAMAERLEEEGVSLVVWNRSPGKAEGLSAEVATTPAELAGRVDVILSVLANDAATDEVYFGPEGFLSQGLDGTLIVEFCTQSPDRSKALAKAVVEAGGSYLECPVGGTVAPARAGKLLGLAGGTAEDFERARPVLEKLTRRLEYMGPVGSGAAMKLSINLPLMVYWGALGEALGLARAGGIDPSLALDILADSSGAIGAAKTRVPPIRDMVVNGDPGGVNIKLEVALKDMVAMVALAEQNGSGNAIIGAARRRAEAALADGFEGLDASLVAAYGSKSEGT